MHSETQKTKELAEIIVEKIRNLFALQSRILETRGQPTQTAAHHDTIEPAEPQDARTPEDKETLRTLETQLKECIKETEAFIDQLKSETPSLKTYILPQMHQIIETLKNRHTARTNTTRTTRQYIDRGRRYTISRTIRSHHYHPSPRQPQENIRHIAQHHKCQF